MKITVKIISPSNELQGPQTHGTKRSTALFEIGALSFSYIAQKPLFHLPFVAPLKPGQS